MLNEFADTIHFAIQALKIGDATIGGLGGEIFAETGLWLKNQSKTKKLWNHFLVSPVFSRQVG